MKRLVGLVLFLALWAPAARGGDSKGNGGHVIVYGDRQNPTRPPELLDYFDGRMRGIQYRLGGRASYQEKIALALGRLDRLDRARAREYGELARKFEDPTISLFASGVTLTLTNDAFPLMLPRNSHLEQIVIQKEPDLPGDRLFTVDADLWKQLDEDNKAGLVLHEAIYREALHAGHTDSRATRIFTATLCSEKFESMNRGEYEAFLKSIRFAIR